MVERYRAGVAQFCSVVCSNKSRVGKPSWNKGLSLKNYPQMGFTKGHRNFVSTESRQKAGQKISKLLIGRKIPVETRIKISQSLLGRYMGDENHNWLGGKSFEPYSVEFNSILKERIRKRDGYRCQECFRHQDELYTETGRRYKLLIHHIDYDKKNNQESNLISLCRSCHGQTNFKREDWQNYYSNKIGGYYE